MKINPYFRVSIFHGIIFLYDCKSCKEYKITTNLNKKVDLKEFLSNLDKDTLRQLKNIGLII